MKIYRLTVIVYVVVFLTALSACNSTSQTYSQNQLANKPYDGNSINPKVVIYNFSNDSAIAYIKLYTNELLFKKDSHELMAHLRIQLFIYPGYELMGLIDSASITFMQPKVDDDKSRYVIASMVFRKPTLAQYLLKFNVIDVNKSSSVVRFLSCSNNNNQNQFSMMMAPVGGEFPSFENYINTTDSFHIYTKPDAPTNAFVRYFKSKQTLAAPPHSSAAIQRFSYAADRSYATALNDSTIFNFKESGIYHFQFDTLKKSGFTIFNFNDAFPNVARAEEMTPPLRYLTTAKEYNNIINAVSTGAAIESFWVERAGNKESARKLISTYYGRMVETNKNFTSYTEGWRTDRGMVYMIMGRPANVSKTDKKEVWNYNNVEGINSLNFEFTKMYNPFTENDFILIRSQLYEMPWYSAVNSWREGRPFGN